jgi:FkbM family methyltransferase
MPVLVEVPDPEAEVLPDWDEFRSIPLRPCHGIGCRFIKQAQQRYNGSAWHEWSTLFGRYRSEAASRGDFASVASLTFLLSAGYAGLLVGGMFPADIPLHTVILSQLHEYYTKIGDRKKYPPFVGMVEPGAWTWHHGLRNASRKVRAFVRNKEILDIGAYKGDSLMVLEQYTDVRVRSYELIPDSAALSQRYANLGNPEKHIVNNVALSDEPGFIRIAQSGHIAASFSTIGNVTVNITTIDNEAQAHNISIGFIKIDIEGLELQVLKGAIKTLKGQHPILSISSYHNIELMDIPVFLEEVGGYRIEFENHGIDYRNLYEQAIMAYPRWLPSR